MALDKLRYWLPWGFSMKRGSISKPVAVAAIGLLAAASAAQAKVEVGQITGELVNGKLVLNTASPKVYKQTFKLTGPVGLKAKTPIVADTLYSTPSCAPITPGTMKPQKKNPDKNGKWSVGKLTATAPTGACSGHKYTYSVLYYTWTNTKSKAGTTDKGVAVWTAQGGKPLDKYTYTYDVTMTLK